MATVGLLIDVVSTSLDTYLLAIGVLRENIHIKITGNNLKLALPIDGVSVPSNAKFLQLNKQFTPSTALDGGSSNRKVVEANINHCKKGGHNIGDASNYTDMKSLQIALAQKLPVNSTPLAITMRLIKLEEKVDRLLESYV